MNEPMSRGLLSIDVKAPTIVAGTATTVSLIIRNPFPEVVVIESIQSPSAAPLLPESNTDEIADGKSFVERLGTKVAGLTVRQVTVGPLVAEFPQQRGREFRFDVQPTSRLSIKSPFEPGDKVLINAQEGSDVVYDVPADALEARSEESPAERIIPPQQEDLASFELKTAHWLFVKPKVLELYALIRFRVGGEPRNQVVPVTLSIQPPVKSIVLGSVFGGILGYLARRLTESTAEAFSVSSTVISALGVIVMATILAIVLSRQEASKGFVTLEDFYGAFVIGAILGYTGSGYFEEALGSGANEAVG